MNFCPKCGRQRVSNRFCGGCGNDFGVPAGDSGTPLEAEIAAQAPPAAAVPIAAETTMAGPMPATAEPAEPTELVAPPPPTTTVPRPFDSGYAQTQYAPLAQPYSALSVTSAPVDPAPSRRRMPGARTTMFIPIGILVALGIGGGVFALVSQSHPHATAQPPSQPTVTANAGTATTALQASASPAATASTSPSTSPSASPTPSPPQTGTVQVAPGVVSNPAEPQVAAYLNRYFNSINTRNYREYNSLLDAQEQQSDSQSNFDSGFATTKDSDELLTAITDTGGGSLTVKVSFTSHQSPADSVDQSACNHWQLSLFLVRQGNQYVMTAAPADYHAAYTNC